MGIFSKIYGLIFGPGTSENSIAEKQEEIVVKEPRKEIDEIKFMIDGVEYKILCVLAKDEETLVWGGKKDRTIEYDLLDPSVNFDPEHLYRTPRIACFFYQMYTDNGLRSWSSFFTRESNEMLVGGPLHMIISLNEKDARIVLSAIIQTKVNIE